MIKSIKHVVVAILATLALISCAQPNAPEVKYKVTYETEFGSKPQSIEVVENTKLTTEQLPILEDANNDFIGWFIGDNKVDIGFIITKDITLKAKWNNHVVNEIAYTFNIEENSLTLTTSTPGATIYYTLDNTNPSKNSAKYENPIIINKETTIKAIALKDGLTPSSVTTINTYTITYKINDEITHLTPSVYISSEEVILPQAEVPKTGYGSNSWYETDSKNGFTTLPKGTEGNKILNLKWEPYDTVRGIDFAKNFTTTYPTTYFDLHIKVQNNDDFANLVIDPTIKNYTNLYLYGKEKMNICNGNIQIKSKAGLNELHIMDNFVKIESQGISGSIKSLFIGEGVEELDISSIDEEVENIFLPSTLKKIHSAFVYSIKNLSNLTISPDNPYLCVENKTIYNKDKTELIRCTDINSTGTFDIPNSVLIIKENAFYESKFSSIPLPSKLTSIGEAAFHNCSNLTSIEIPSSVATLPNMAFNLCSKLNSIILNEGLITIGPGVFSVSSIKTINIPSTVTKIDTQAFSSCEALESIIIPEGVQELGESSFNSCTALTNATLPKSLTKCASDIFKHCNALKTINFNGTEDQWNTLGITLPTNTTKVNYLNN